MTGTLILVPQALAFATIAGMPPEYGLYAAVAPVIVAALFGSSWHMVSGPTTAISILVFAALAPIAEPESPEFVQLALTLAFLTGIISLALGWLRLGSLMNYVSHTVVVGFTAGAAVLIAASQVKNFFGLAVPRGANLAQVLESAVAQLDRINPWVTGVAIFTLVVSVVAKRHSSRTPHMVVALLLGSALAASLNFLLGPARTGIAGIGGVAGGLPPLSAPDLSAESIRQVLPIAIAVTMLSLTEAMSISRSLAMRSEQPVDANQEFIGQGLSNIVGAFFSAYPSSGSFNRSGLNFASGARTPLAAVLSALLLLVVLPFVAPLSAFLPLPAMAGVLVLVAWGLIDFKDIGRVLRSDRQEAVVLVTTFLSTLLMNLEFAIYIGVLLSLLLYLHRTSRPGIADVKPAVDEGEYHFSQDTGLPDCPQLKMLRVNGSLFFGAVDHVRRTMTDVDAANPSQKFLLLACPGVNFIDLAGSQMLAQEARRRRRIGGDLFLFNLKDEARHALSVGGYEDLLDGDHAIPIGSADPISRIIPRLNQAMCATCTRRIFRQCPPRSSACGDA